jgi:hypothetical protein
MGIFGAFITPAPAKRPTFNSVLFGAAIAFAYRNNRTIGKASGVGHTRLSETIIHSPCSLLRPAFLFTSRTAPRRIIPRFKWSGSYQQRGRLEIHMSDCPLILLTTNLKHLKQFEQTGQVVIPLSDWIRFFETLAFLNRDGGRRETYCAFVGEYLVFSKTPIERTAKKEPTQSELSE